MTEGTPEGCIDCGAPARFAGSFYCESHGRGHDTIARHELLTRVRDDARMTIAAVDVGEREWVGRELNRHADRANRALERIERARRAAWWARGWSCALLWRDSRFVAQSGLGEPARVRGHVAWLSERQRSRIHHHEKDAWARLEAVVDGRE